MLALGLSLTEPSLSPGNDLDFLIAHLPVLGISGEDGIYKDNSYLECKKISLLMLLFYNQFKLFIYLICICVYVCLGVLWGYGSCFPLWAYGDSLLPWWFLVFNSDCQTWWQMPLHGDISSAMVMFCRKTRATVRLNREKYISIYSIYTQTYIHTICHISFYSIYTISNYYIVYIVHINYYIYTYT